MRFYINIIVILLISALYFLSCSTEDCDENNEKEFYEQSFYMAHAFGEINGETYTNSKEAFELSYKKGYRLFEVDLSMSKEGIPVCRHYGWDEFSYDEYMTTPIGRGGYTPVDINFLIRQIIEKSDIWFDLDLYADKKAIIEYLINSDEWSKVSVEQKKEFLNKFIIECYGINSYDEISKIYKFKYMPITLSTMTNSTDTHSTIISFCKDNAIPFVILSYSWLSEEIVSFYKNNDIGIYCYTVNDLDECQTCKSYGILGIQTDCLYKST